jgi:hypothetical protein
MRYMGVSKSSWPTHIKDLEARGFPKKDPRHLNSRDQRAIKMWNDLESGIPTNGNDNDRAMMEAINGKHN